MMVIAYTSLLLLCSNVCWSEVHAKDLSCNKGLESDQSENFSNEESSRNRRKESYDGNILKTLLLHLIKYPRRLNRAEGKSENYSLRANYIPRLGRKRNYPI
nr:uncharacterized protein LOC110282268 [Parasteatoda tepidariorum]